MGRLQSKKEDDEKVKERRRREYLKKIEVSKKIMKLRKLSRYVLLNRAKKASNYRFKKLKRMSNIALRELIGLFG